MKRLFVSILPFIFTSVSSAQGSWNIGYIPVDRLHKDHIGKIIRIDFKTLNLIRETSKTRNIRDFVGTRDTATLFIDSTEIKVAERRKIYPDHGSYDDQFLDCLNCNGLIFQIYDAEIVEIGEHSILFKLEIETQEKTSKKPNKFSKLVWIDKAGLDGMMYKL